MSGDHQILAQRSEEARQELMAEVKRLRDLAKERQQAVDAACAATERLRRETALWHAERDEYRTEVERLRSRLRVALEAAACERDNADSYHILADAVWDLIES